MIDLLLTAACFAGLFYAVNAGLKIHFQYTPLFCVSVISILLYLFAMTGYLALGSQILIYSGYMSFVIFIMNKWRNHGRKKTNNKNYGVFIGLSIAAFLLSLNMAFTVIDDYVYWGIIGKYLFLNDHLPIEGNPLDPRILAYTPGTALFHYFFYSLWGEYSRDISYFAQSFILLSAIFVVAQKENFKNTIVYMSTLILLLTLFSGSVFTKLQVDYLLAVIVFSIFWIYYFETEKVQRIFIISASACFLFLIKEIGFVLGILVLVFVFTDTLISKDQGSSNKVKTLGVLILSFLFLFALKSLWTNHFVTMGFKELHSGINLASVQNSLEIFTNDDVRNGFFIFIKAIFLESADRLNIPYIAWYGVVGFLCFKIYNHGLIKDTKRFYLFTGLASASLLLYLFMLYILQIIMFDVGKSYQHTVGFSRYWNIFFTPVVLISVLLYLHKIILVKFPVGKKGIWITSGIIMVLLLASRIEVTIHRETEDVQVERAAAQIDQHLEKEIQKIGTITGKEDNLAMLQFLYYLLPNHIDITKKKFDTLDSVINYSIKHDYIIVYHPDQRAQNLLNQLLDSGNVGDGISLLRVVRKGSDQNIDLNFERIVL